MNNNIIKKNLNNKTNELLSLKDERNYGIDLLRIISMFFIVILHCLGQGGILKNTIPNSTQYKFAWLMEIFAYCAVNIFALISGYVSYSNKEKRTKYSNYINIWLQVVFYGLLITGIFNFIKPELIHIKDYILVLFPVSNGLYWYVTAYTGLFVLMPFLNKGIRNCSDRTLKKLFIVIIIAFSIFDTITKRFVLSGGYSFIWIVLLYILGAIIKKCEIGKNVKCYHALFGICILCLITYIYKIYGWQITKLNVKITNDILVSYTSPTILGISILYIIGFSKINFTNIFKKVIKFAAPSTFAVYLLNNHRHIWEYVLKNLFVKISNQSILKIFVYTVGFSILFVIGSILIDKVRVLLFKVCKVSFIIDKIEEILNKIITKISDLI